VASSVDEHSDPRFRAYLFDLLNPLQAGGFSAPKAPQTSPNERSVSTASPFEALEVQKQSGTLTQGSGIPAPLAPEVSLSVTNETFAILERLHKAGIIDLGQTLVQTNEKLIAWTYEDLQRDMIAVQKLRPTKIDGRESTVGCRLRYLRYLEQHPAAPVQLRPPNERSWLDHVAYRLQDEGASGSALNHYRKALKSLNAYLGLHWPSLNKRFEEVGAHWSLPPDDLVPRFWGEAVHPDKPNNRYLNETLRHVFHWGFWGGTRPPSELSALNLSDVNFRERTVTVTEPKKGGRKRDLVDVEPFVVTASNGKSLWHYATYVRPNVARPDSVALFLDENGDRWHPNKLGNALSEAGKAIWPDFIPYTMRRWCATKRLIDSGFNVYHVADWLGDTVATVEKHYLAKAEAKAGMKGQFHARRRRLAHG